MTGLDVIEALRANYFATETYEVRTSVDSAGFARLLVLVKPTAPTRLFGLRFVDFPSAPPTLRFWQPKRWTEDFEFDFTTNGDTGTGTSQTPSGIATMCVPYHVDYYKNAWHSDWPWKPADAGVLVADLVGNILRRA